MLTLGSRFNHQTMFLEVEEACHCEQVVHHDRRSCVIQTETRTRIPCTPTVYTLTNIIHSTYVCCTVYNIPSDDVYSGKVQFSPDRGLSYLVIA